MERKSKVNESASGNSSTDGAKSKEMALEKLRKMEWKRNTQDTWHLARSNSRGNDVQERKKYNKDEDNYFEGTGVQKTKKLRKPRVSESTPAVPPGFCISSTPGPPQVNAWAKKKGSALFQKEDEIDAEDQVIKLAIQESLRSHEEDEKRRMERFKMANLDLPTSSQAMCAEKDWEEEFRKEDFNAKPYLSEFQEDSQKRELHFVETDPKEEPTTVNQRHRFVPPRPRKNGPQEKSTSSSVKTSYDFPEPKKVPSPPMNKNICPKVEVLSREDESEPDNDEFFEPSRPQTKYSKPIDRGNEMSFSSSPYVTPSNSTVLHRAPMKHPNINPDDLSDNFNNTLSFGDTQGLLEKIREDELKQTGGAQNFKTESPSYLTTSDCIAQAKPINPCEPSETDILLHNFIRHEPPSYLNSSAQLTGPDMSTIKQSESNDIFSLPTSAAFSSQNLNSGQSYATHQVTNIEQHPFMNGMISSALPGGIQISNGRDSGSSVSGSPMQNITPYGSFEKDVHSGVQAGVHAPSQIGSVPYPYPYSMESNQENLTRHLQTMQLMNQNLSPTMNTQYSLPTPIRGVVPINPQVGQPQYRLPNSNMMMPSFQGQNMSPLLLQHQLQQAHLQQMQMPPGYLPQMMALEAARLQQLQLAAGVAESDDSAVKEQANITKSQILNNHQLLTQSQLLTQNQPQVLQLQNHPQMLQNHPQAVPSERTSPKQEEVLQQHISQGTRPGGKTKEELQAELQSAIQALKRVQEQMQEAQVQAPIPVAQPQPAWGVISQSPTMPLPINQFFPLGMIPQVHPHLIQQSQSTGLISPTIQHPQQNLPGFMNISPQMSPESEINLAQEPNQTSQELKIGRGRGRIH